METLCSVQVSYDGAISNPVIMPVAAANPGLLTLSFLEISSGSAGGVILNEDGTLNDVQNPAACGSTITIYATGLSVTMPPIDSGSITTSASVRRVRMEFCAASPPFRASALSFGLASLRTSRLVPA